MYTHWQYPWPPLTVLAALAGQLSPPLVCRWLLQPWRETAGALCWMPVAPGWTPSLALAVCMCVRVRVHACSAWVCGK